MSSKEMRYEYKRIGSTITKCFLHRSINVNTTMGKSSIWSRGPPRRNISRGELLAQKRVSLIASKCCPKTSHEASDTASSIQSPNQSSPRTTSASSLVKSVDLTKAFHFSPIAEIMHKLGRAECSASWSNWLEDMVRANSWADLLVQSEAAWI